MIDWPPTLVNDLARRKSVVVIGSGVSKQAKSSSGATAPLWKEFLNSAVSNCPAGKTTNHIVGAIEKNDLLHACEWLKDAFEEDWPNQLRKYFSEPIFFPSEIHEQIMLLDSRVIFSLNFDKIMEQALSAHDKSVSHIKNYYDSDVSEFLRGDKRYLVKIHGSIDSPDKIIFTQRDYSEARVKHNSFYSAFDAALLTNTFLFIGCGYSDPDTNLLLENHAFGFPTANPHYFLSANGLDGNLISSLRRNRNLKVLEYDKIDDVHTGLVEEIKILNEMVDAERQVLMQTNNW